MIAVDTNILLYAHRRDVDWHDRAAASVRRLAEGPGAWMIPWPCVHEFLAVATHPRVYARPSTLEEALRQVELWKESPGLVIEGESERHWLILREQLIAGRVSGPAVHDARIAAICTAHRVEALWSADRGFSRFPGLRVVNPLMSGPA